MRIAVTLGGTDWGLSGIGTYVRAVLPRLIAAVGQQGGTVLALGTDRDFAAYRDVLEGAECLRSVPSDRPATSALWYLFRSDPFARRHRADVLLLLAASRRMPFRPVIPTVAVVHDLTSLHVPHLYDVLRMGYLRYLVIPAYARVSEIVAISGSTRNDLVSALGLDGESIRVVPNGVDHQRFRPLTGDDAAIAKVRAVTGLDGPYLLYAARLEHPHKNHLRLLRAYAASAARRTHRLALSGSDWGAGPLVLEERARLGLEDRVRILGFLERDMVPPLFAGADGVIMVGLHEGFGLPALEALACGRPVCASSTGALPEVVGPLGAICDPMDESSIAASLDRLVGDAALRARCAEEGPAWAAARGWERTVAGLIEACGAAANGGATRRG